MFVYSVKSSKIKMVILILLVLLLVLAMLLVTHLHQPAEAGSELNIKAENAQQRVAFLSQFGWRFDEDPVEVAEVIIPPEFDSVYEQYNAIQKELLSIAKTQAKLQKSVEAEISKCKELLKSKMPPGLNQTSESSFSQLLALFLQMVSSLLKKVLIKTTSLKISTATTIQLT